MLRLFDKSKEIIFRKEKGNVIVQIDLNGNASWQVFVLSKKDKKKIIEYLLDKPKD